MDLLACGEYIKKINRWGLGIPLLLLLILIMLIFSLPPMVLDCLFTVNIAVSILILFSGLSSLKPLDFGVFPTVLLVSTLMRLALNIASTRVVLLFGHQGTGAAGDVIKAFGEVVVGGNTVVGFVVFAIFIIINFMVITKGAGRISEVSARFTLDAMPGKQMAIDADLNAGGITLEAAQKRRAEVTQEADFYGAMDGASKFIRGDAMAGLLIVFINWIGGTCVGFFQHNMGIMDALKTYALLTIGDGLAAQIPALILSTAAAIMVTRVSSDQNISQQISNQVFRHAKSLIYAAGIILGLGVLPGMPHAPFMLLGLFMGGVGFIINQQRLKSQEKKQQESFYTTQLAWEAVALFEPIVIAMGKGLIPLAEDESSSLRLRLQDIRKQSSMEWGFVLPEPIIRVNHELHDNQYQLLVYGFVVGEGTLEHHKDSAVLLSHFTQAMKEKAYQLLDQDAVQQLMAILSKNCPSLVEDLVPRTLSLGVITQVLRNLLQEQVPIQNLKTIVEALGQAATKTQDPELLTRFARVAVGHLIIQKINGFSSEMSAIRLSPDLENLLQQSLQLSHQEHMTIEPGLAEQMQRSIKILYEKYRAESETLIFLVPSSVRRALSQFVHSFLKQVTVLSYEELPTDQRIKIIATVGQ
jgi:flagellar biosynthesis protein FlhA